MPRCSEERKAAVIEKMMPPHNTSIPGPAKETGISDTRRRTGRAACIPGISFNPHPGPLGSDSRHRPTAPVPGVVPFTGWGSLYIVRRYWPPTSNIAWVICPSEQ